MNKPSIDTYLPDLIDQAMEARKPGFLRRWKSFSRQFGALPLDDPNMPGGLQKLIRQVEASVATCRQRQAMVVPVHYPDLPVSSRRDAIMDALSRHQVIVVAGETGSGKTTQLPKICLEMGFGRKALIGHTQPRRLAARSIAQRLAEELGEQGNAWVGHKVRFSDSVKDSTLVKLMTDGILLAEIQSDRLLRQYDVIIIDEAHERSLNVDFLLGYLKQILPRRPDLKVIITSATIDHERFSRHFNEAPVIEVSGRQFPVEMRYLPPEKKESGEWPEPWQQVVEVLHAIDREHADYREHDILVFLSGEREIRELHLGLKKHLSQSRHARWRATEILPLYSRLGYREQQKIFQPHSGRRIVLSTNVAETSLTVPGIRVVIDFGEARISRYSYRNKIQRLPVEQISRASANQRAGRCGRVANGLCFRLYDEQDFQARPEFTEPEIQRTNLASVILQMQALSLGAVEDFPFVDKPDARFVRDGVRQLVELGALKLDGTLTRLGRELARLPTDPRIGRMLLAAHRYGCAREILVIASALSIQDPRDQSVDHRQAAREKLKPFLSPESDFITLLNLWQWWEEKREALSSNQLRKLAREYYLNFLRMREWREVHHQLTLMYRQLGYGQNSQPADYASIHKALLSGLLEFVMQREEPDGQPQQKTARNKGVPVYRGARNKRLMVFPGSSLVQEKKSGHYPWLVAAEQIETSRLYASTVARVEPEWIEPLAKHILKLRHDEPHWEKRRGQVVARETATLYGLPIYSGRKVNFGKIDPVLARDIFIRSGLVEGEMHTRCDFFHQNQRLLEQVEAHEHRSRSKGILVDEETLFAFYDERIPPDICTVRQLESWYKSLPEEEQHALLFEESSLYQSEPVANEAYLYPRTLSLAGMNLPLEYHFEPGHERDGVAVKIPRVLLDRVSPYELEWLVPGLLREKCETLLRALPKRLRKHLVPIPDYAQAVLESIEPGDYPLCDALAREIHRMTGITIEPEDWQPDQLPVHLNLLIDVVDDSGEVLLSGRSLVDLREQLAGKPVEGAHDAPVQPEPLETVSGTDWVFGDIPEQEGRPMSGIQIQMWCGLVDQTETVSLEYFDHESAARNAHRQGVTRLLVLGLSREITGISRPLKQDRSWQELHKTWRRFKYPDCASKLPQALVAMALPASEEVWQVRTASAFEILKQQVSTFLADKHERLLSLLRQVMEQVVALEKQLSGNFPLAWAHAHRDIRDQLHRLFPENFLSSMNLERLQDYQRYCRAIDYRIDKLGGQLPKDKTATAQLADYYRQYDQRLAAHQKLHVNDPALEEWRWMLEEWRVSLFAQALGTRMPVSEKRLKAAWQLVKPG